MWRIHLRIDVQGEQSGVFVAGLLPAPRLRWKPTGNGSAAGAIDRVQYEESGARRGSC